MSDDASMGTEAKSRMTTDASRGTAARSIGDTSAITQAGNPSSVAALSPKEVELGTKALILMASFFLKELGGKAALTYNKIGLTILANILASVRQGRSIDGKISQLNGIIKQLEEQAQRLTTNARKLPSGPFAKERSGGLLALLILSPDPAIAKTIQARRQAYRQAVQAAYEAMNGFLEPAESLMDQLRANVADIQQQVKALNLRSSVQQVLREGYLKKLEFIQLEVETGLNDAVTSVRECRRYLSALLTSE
jgi:hypothetical protein